MIARRNSDRRGGYVLIEAMAALALSGLVLATVPLASGMLIRNWQKVTTASDTLDQLATGLAVIRRELSSIRRERWVIDKDTVFTFEGSAEKVGFVIADAGVRNAPGTNLIELSTQTGLAGSTLTRNSTPFRPGLAGFDKLTFTDPVILLSGPWRYKFYFAEETDGALAWKETWDEPTKLPVAIRLDVLNFQTDAPVVPPMVVPLRITAEPGCISREAGQCSS
jgi:hypothetical protein